MFSIVPKASKVLRRNTNSHHFICFLNGKIRAFNTALEDINTQVATLFSQLNMPFAAAFLFSVVLAGTSQAAPGPNDLPTGAAPISGISSVTQTGNQLTVITNAQKSIMEYAKFNIGSNASVIIQQPNAQAYNLSRVTGGNMSEIYGTLQSNGRVFLINPAGLFFGNGCNINVSGLVASTLDISNNQFLNGQFQFVKGLGNPGTGINTEKGANINIQNNGSASFLGSFFSNAGTVSAPNGAIQVGVGDRVSLGNDLIGITVDEPLKVILNKAAILNTGTFDAHDVKLIASLMKQNMLDVMVNNSGRISATRLVNGPDGSIELVADHGHIAQAFGSMTGDTISMTTQDGNISQTGGTINTNTLNASTTTAGNSIQLTDTDSNTASLKTNNGNILLKDQDGVNLNAQAGSGNATIDTSALGLTSNNSNQTQGLTLIGSSTANTFTLNSHKGNISQAAGSNVQGTLLDATTETSGSKIILTNADFDQAAFRTNKGNITYFDQDGISLNMNLPGLAKAEIRSDVGGTANNGSGTQGITLTGNNQVGSLQLTANAGNIQFAAGSHTNTTSTEATAVAGNIQQGANSTLTGSAFNATTQQAGKSISIADADFGEVTLKTNNGNVAYKDSDNFNLNVQAGTGTVSAESDVAGLISDNNGAPGQGINIVGDNQAGRMNLTSHQGILSFRPGSSTTADTVTLITDHNFIIQNANSKLAGNILNARSLEANKSMSFLNADFNRVNLQTNQANITYYDSDKVTANIQAGNKTADIQSGVAGLTSDNGVSGQGLVLTGNNLAGLMKLKTGLGDISQALGSTVQGATLEATAQGSSGRILLTNVDFDTATLKTNNGAVSLFDHDGITVNVQQGGTTSTDIRSDLGVKADNGNVTHGIRLTGDNQAGSLKLTANDGDILLDANSNTTAVSVTATAARGDIWQDSKSTLQGGALNATTQQDGKGIFIADADFGKVKLTTNNGDIEYSDSDQMDLTVQAGTGSASIQSDVSGLLSDNKGAVGHGINLIGDNHAGILDLTANQGLLTLRPFSHTSADIVELAAFNGQIIQRENSTISGGTLGAFSSGNRNHISLIDTDFQHALLQTDNGNITYYDKDGVTTNFQAGTGTVDIQTSKPGLVSDNSIDGTDLVVFRPNNFAGNLNLIAHQGHIITSPSTNIQSLLPNGKIQLTTANSAGSIFIGLGSNIEAKQGSVSLNSNSLNLDGFVQGGSVQIWPWNLNLGMGVAGGSGTMQLSQNLFDHINTDTGFGLNSIMLGHQNYAGTISMGSLNFSNKPLTELVLNAPSVLDVTPNDDALTNIIMAADRSVYFTAGASDLAQWNTAPGGVAFGSSVSPLTSDLDVTVSGAGTIHVRLQDFEGDSNTFNLTTVGGNQAFINVAPTDINPLALNSVLEPNGLTSFRNFFSMARNRSATLIQNNIKNNSINLSGNTPNSVAPFNSYQPVPQLAPNQLF